MNSETLELLEELATQDPGSSIFLHVARLYRTHGESQRAVAVLRRGLSHHPGHIEAGLLLADILAEEGEMDAALVQATGERLLRFPRFWQALAQESARTGNPDLALVAGLMALVAQHATRSIPWHEVLFSGVREALAAVEGSPVRAPENDLDADEVSQFCLNPNIRTKTMAKLFAMHGEHEQALAIYEELLAKAQSDAERTELAALCDAERRLAGVTPSGSQLHAQAITLLQRLAERLETKTSARS